MISKPHHIYAWLFCGFAALGACILGYDGVYFNGVSSLVSPLPPEAHRHIPHNDQDIFVKHFGTETTDGQYKISPSQLSVMTSMINVGELVGSLSAAPLNDLVGRKIVFLVAAAVIVIGVVLQLVTSSSKSLITVGRAIMGLGVGAFSSTSPLYIAVSTIYSKSAQACSLTSISEQEVAPTSIRGPLLMCWQLTISLAQILAAAITKGIETDQTTLAYRLPIGFQLLFPALVFAFYALVPESPRWLLRAGKDEKAKAALQAIHKDDKTYNPEQHLVTLRAAIDTEEILAAESSWSSLLTDPIERRKLIFSAGALIAQQINGIQWFYYFGTVFSKAIGLKDPFLMAVIVFLIQTVTVFLAVLFANKIPRRPLLLTTTAIMTVSIFIVGCLGIPDGDVSPTFGKVIISFVIIEITAFNFGWGPLGWTIVSF